MEFLQTLTTALTTPNEGFLNVIFIFFGIIETIVTMLFFTKILNIESTKKQKIIFVVLVQILTTPISFIVSNTFTPIFKLLVTLFLTKICFKISISKTLLAQIIPLVIFSVLETILIKIYTFVFNIDYVSITIVPFYRLSLLILMYFIFYILYRLVKHFNITLSILENMKKSMIIGLILGIIAILIQIYLVNFYNDNLPVLITVLGTTCSIFYFFINIYSLTRTAKLEITTQNLEQAQQYNKSLKILHDNLRSFKHDFGNIIQAIGGYVSTNDMEGFTTYYYQLLEDCNKVNNLAALSPDVINNPAIYSILASKYFKCDDLDIKINLDIFLDLNTLNCKIYEFTRILGILMDNAIEAANECEEMIINVEIRKDPSVNRQLLIIENTYLNKDINIDEIFKKNYTSKPNHSGIGLWEVNQILNKNTNLALYTTKNEVFFKQQFEMYEK